MNPYRDKPAIQPGVPRAPDIFTRDWANQLTRWLENLQRVGAFSLLRGSGIYLVGLPSSGSGLKPGEVFSNGGVLTIVREGETWLGSVSTTTAIGTLTVST